MSADIEEGYQQAECGELIDGAQARREIQVIRRLAFVQTVSVYAPTPLALAAVR